MKRLNDVRILHPIADELYQYVLGRRFDPGAEAEVFEPLFALPVINFRGRARVAGTLAILQPAQTYFTPQIGVVGLGGIQAGQVISQPLLDPSDFEGA